MEQKYHSSNKSINDKLVSARPHWTRQFKIW